MEAIVTRSVWVGLEELEGDLRAYLGRRCRDQSELDDVVQETLLRAARFRPSMAGPRNLRGWAMRIGGNVLRDRQRRESRLPRHGPAGAPGLEDLADESDPFDEDQGQAVLMGGRWVGRGEAVSIVRRSLERLGSADRAVLDAYYGLGHCTERIAGDQGLPRDLVKVRLFRARRRLMRRLGAIGYPAPREGVR